MDQGLSPRVRGNLVQAVGGITHKGSIPACAGEPTPDDLRLRGDRVYPRVCGGTMDTKRRFFVSSGLSPRVRGNLMSTSGFQTRPRSIPACAGEPRYSRTTDGHCGVYPRVCGGTPKGIRRDTRVQGLSPRVRGNRWLPPSSQSPRGSIPACAGEPRSLAHPACPIAVYPRVCGGT